MLPGLRLGGWSRFQYLRGWSPHLFEGGYRSAESAAPPKIQVSSQPVRPCPHTNCGASLRWTAEGGCPHVLF